MGARCIFAVRGDAAAAEYDTRMDRLPDFVLLALLAAVVFFSLWLGVRLGKRVGRERVPDSDHLGTIQGAILGLLGLVLGFSFSGAMSRFIDRQDALATEANAIETAYERAELLPTADRVQECLREYAALRLELFHNSRGKIAEDLESRLVLRHDAARRAAYEGAVEVPQFAMLVITGIEDVGDEFERRSAIDRRHLPNEMILVLIFSSGLAMGTIGYGVGIAERRSVGSATALAALVSITLFVTLDFDRPNRGLIFLDPTPLENIVRSLQAQPVAR